MAENIAEQCFDAVCRQLPELDCELGLANCVGDKSFYLDILKDFTELPIKEELVKYLVGNNSENYTIRVHGFKNNAYTVGATEIGDLAYKIEVLSKVSLAENVLDLQRQMFEKYDSICRRYGEIMFIYM